MKIQEVNCLTGETIIRDLTIKEKTAQDEHIANREATLFDRRINKLRNKRNKLLADSDWEVTMAKEKGTNLSSAFKTWRQDLRDITEGLTTVEEVEGVVFPEKP
tara:strand:- start:708 stop:1019 length:312 start_codon:yes stop_codon:yes gene_type:complete